MEKVSVIIVTYNGERWIDRCLKSVMASSFPCEIIIIDNASHDRTKEIISQNFNKVTLIELQENIGFGRANNKGLALAMQNGCDYVFLLNQDAIIFKTTIEDLIQVAKNFKNYGIISPIHLSTSKNIDPSFRYYFKNYGSDQLLTDLLLKKELKEVYEFKMINAAAWLLPLKTLKTVGGFHPMFFLYGEDDNYCQRVIFHGLKIGVAPSAYIIHDSDNNNLVQPERGSKKYFEKFKTQIKVKYANVNDENHRKLGSLQQYYFKQALKNLISLNISEFKINLHKRNLIGRMDFISDVEETRKVNSAYLKKEFD